MSFLRGFFSSLSSSSPPCSGLRSDSPNTSLSSSSLSLASHKKRQLNKKKDQKTNSGRTSRPFHRATVPIHLVSPCSRVPPASAGDVPPPCSVSLLSPGSLTELRELRALRSLEEEPSLWPAIHCPGPPLEPARRKRITIAESPQRCTLRSICKHTPKKMFPPDSGPFSLIVESTKKSFPLCICINATRTVCRGPS